MWTDTYLYSDRLYMLAHKRRALSPPLHLLERGAGGEDDPTRAPSGLSPLPLTDAPAPGESAAPVPGEPSVPETVTALHKRIATLESISLTLTTQLDTERRQTQDMITRLRRAGYDGPVQSALQAALDAPKDLRAGLDEVRKLLSDKHYCGKLTDSIKLLLAHDEERAHYRRLWTAEKARADQLFAQIYRAKDTEKEMTNVPTG